MNAHGQQDTQGKQDKQDEVMEKQRQGRGAKETHRGNTRNKEGKAA